VLFRSVKAAWEALLEITKGIEKEDMEKYVSTARKAIASVSEDMDESASIEGFDLPKGISPVMPIFIQGLMLSTNDIRSQAALGLGDLVRRTSPTSLRPFAATIIGPLIRVMGDRFPSTVKSAILQTIGDILDKVPALLKPFLPQLQRTFIKCLSDPASSVRDRGARCLSVLIVMQTRLDPLVVELTQGVRASEEKGIKEAMLEALFGLLNVVSKDSGREITALSKASIQSTLLETLFGSCEKDEALQIRASKCIGSFVSSVDDSDAKLLVTSKILNIDDSNWTNIYGSLLCIQQIISQSPLFFHEQKLTAQVINLTTNFLNHQKPQVVIAVVKIIGCFLAEDMYVKKDLDKRLIPHIIEILAPDFNSDVRKEAITTLKNLAKSRHEIIEPFMVKIVPALLVCVRDASSPIKIAAARAINYCIKFGQNSNKYLQKLMGSLDASTGKAITDFSKKVLSKQVNNIGQ